MLPPLALALEFHRAKVLAPPRRRAIPAAPATAPLRILFMGVPFRVAFVGSTI
jgi:hypothetical protein